jgi:hypothetical protein
MPMAILALAIFSEPVSSTILLPFIYFMVSIIHHDKPLYFSDLIQ